MCPSSQPLSPSIPFALGRAGKPSLSYPATMDNKSRSLLSTVPGTVLGLSHEFTHLVLASLSGRNSYYPHYTDEKSEVQRG